jgi:prophage maintenance system killer protein
MITKSVNYLTVQDILWVNLQVSKEKVSSSKNTFNNARLEEASFYQYAYGDSQNIPAQAARIAPGFIKMNPFTVANKATAFVTLVAFLNLNHYDVTIEDSKAATWFEGLINKEPIANSLTHTDGHGHGHALEVKSTIENALKRFPITIKKLS